MTFSDDDSWDAINDDSFFFDHDRRMLERAEQGEQPQESEPDFFLIMPDSQELRDLKLQQHRKRKKSQSLIEPHVKVTKAIPRQRAPKRARNYRQTSMMGYFNTQNNQDDNDDQGEAGGDVSGSSSEEVEEEEEELIRRRTRPWMSRKRKLSIVQVKQEEEQGDTTGLYLGKSPLNTKRPRSNYEQRTEREGNIVLNIIYQRAIRILQSYIGVGNLLQITDPTNHGDHQASLDRVKALFERVRRTAERRLNRGDTDFIYPDIDKFISDEYSNFIMERYAIQDAFRYQKKLDETYFQLNAMNTRANNLRVEHPSIAGRNVTDVYNTNRRGREQIQVVSRQIFRQDRRSRVIQNIQVIRDLYIYLGWDITKNNSRYLVIPSIKTQSYELGLQLKEQQEIINSLRRDLERKRTQQLPRGKSGINLQEANKRISALVGKGKGNDFFPLFLESNKFRTPLPHVSHLRPIIEPRSSILPTWALSKQEQRQIRQVKNTDPDQDGWLTQRSRRRRRGTNFRKKGGAKGTVTSGYYSSSSESD